METIKHFFTLSKWINENYCNLKYDWNYLFTERVIELFLEMKITPERLELGRRLGFNNFMVGNDSSKESLVIEFSSSEITEDASKLLNAIINEKLSEVNDGIKTSLNGQVISEGNKIILKVYNELDKDFLVKYINNYFGQKLNEEAKVKIIDDYLKKFEELKQEQSETIKIDLTKDISEDELKIGNQSYNKEKANKFWNKVFNIFGGFVGYIRSLWIFKFGVNKEKQITVDNKEINEPIIVNSELVSQTETFPRYFHIQPGSRFNREIFREIINLNKKYGIRIKVNYGNKKSKKNKKVLNK